MNILVTGASGFIGGRLVQSLVNSENYSVFGTGRTVPKSFSSNASFIPGDITSLIFTKEVTRGMDCIVHCAGLAGTWGAYANYYRANVMATENLLKSAKANGVSRFVNISSPSIYFDFKNQFNLKESDLPKKFSNHYAKTKYEAELLVSKFHCKGFETVSLRPRSVIGAGDNNVLPRLMKLQEAGHLKQVGSGENEVDITTVGNLIDAIILCFGAPADAMGEVYNISNGEPLRFWDFVDSVLDKFGIASQRKNVPQRLAMSLAQLNEWRCRLFNVKEEPSFIPISIGILSQSMTLDIRKAQQKLGYRPRLSTQDGIEEFALWWKAR